MSIRVSQRVVRGSVRGLVAFAVSIVCVFAPPMANLASAQGIPPGGAKPVIVNPTLRISQQFSTKAMAYTQAVSGLQQVSKMQLRTGNAADFQAVVTKMEAFDEKLRVNSFDRMVKIAEGEATFKAGIEAAAEREGADKLAARLNASPTQVMQISGAPQAASAIRVEMKRDKAIVQQLASSLQAATKGIVVQLDLGAGERDMTADLADPTPDPFVSLLADPAYAVIGADDAIVIALGAAAVLLIGAYASAKGQDFQENPTQTDTRSDFKKCTDRAYNNRQACLRRAGSDWFKQTGCWAIYYVDFDTCLVFPQ
jgi:hypothetical protein